MARATLRRMKRYLPLIVMTILTVLIAFTFFRSGLDALMDNPTVHKTGLQPISSAAGVK